MGQMALGAVKSIANSDDLLDTSNEQQSFIYYDILGRFMFAYSFTFYQYLNFLALLFVPIVAVYMSISRNKDHQSISSILKKNAFLTLQGLIAAFSAFIIIILFTVLAVLIMVKINPSMTYGDVYGAALYTFVSVFLGLQLSQLLLPKKLKQTLTSTNAAWYGLISFWWILVVCSCIAGFKGIAALYFAVHLLVFNSLAGLLHLLLPATKKFRSPLIYFLQTIVPFTLLLELDFLVMDAMRHSTADGTPELAGKLPFSFHYKMTWKLKFQSSLYLDRITTHFNRYAFLTLGICSWKPTQSHCISYYRLLISLQYMFSTSTL